MGLPTALRSTCVHRTPKPNRDGLQTFDSSNSVGRPSPPSWIAATTTSWVDESQKSSGRASPRNGRGNWRSWRRNERVWSSANPVRPLPAEKILELAKQAENLYKSQDPTEQRRLLETVLSNCAFDRGSLSPTYSLPFDLLVRGNETSDVLPIPASPVTKTTCRTPSPALASAADVCCTADSRPTKGPDTPDGHCCGPM
jgi:hypothetical protein